MGLIQLRRPWTEQPQTVVDVRRDGIAAGLTFAWIGNALIAPDLISGLVPAQVGAGSVGATRVGLGYKAAAGSGNGLSFGAIQAVPPGSTTHTIIVIAAPVANATGLRQSLFTQGNDGSGAYDQYALLADATGALGAGSAGDFMYAHYDGAVKAYAWASGTTSVDGLPHVFGAVRNGTTAAVYRDGIDVTAGTAGSGASTAGATSGALLVNGAYGSSRACTGPNSAVFVFSRALSAAEMMMLGRSIYAPFELLLNHRTIHIPLAAAAGGAPTITALSARLITTTSAQPRISYS